MLLVTDMLWETRKTSCLYVNLKGGLNGLTVTSYVNPFCTYLTFTRGEIGYC